MPDPMRTRTRLIVIQATPFCNVNCRYCYLPHRSSTKRIDNRTLKRTFEFLFAEPLLLDPASIVWHAGEPLVLPVSFYENAFRIAEQCNTQDVRIVHSFQTNGTLIDQEWCDFISQYILFSLLSSLVFSVLLAVIYLFRLCLSLFAIMCCLCCQFCCQDSV